MGVRLHGGGRTRAWIGRRLGGDEALGDRIWRRCLHVGGLVVLLVFVLPTGVFGPVPVRLVLLLALAVVLALELLRYGGRVELPTIRAHERARVASFAYYAVALVVAVLLFPEAAATAAVVGAALVDPLLGELRAAGVGRGPALAAGFVAWTLLGFTALRLLSGAPGATLLALAALGGAVAVACEGPASVVPIDDDLAMVILPGLLLAAYFWSVAGAAWP